MLFVSGDNEIEKEALRQFAMAELRELKQWAESAFLSSEGDAKWNEVHDFIVANAADDERDKLLAVEGQLRGIPHFIDGWIQSAVDTAERFDFFVRVKAEEVASGSAEHDYFWALQIRHDQLVALVTVLTRLKKAVNGWMTKGPAGIIEDPVYRGLTEYSVEDQVYLEAEQVYKRRQEMMG